MQGAAERVVGQPPTGGGLQEVLHQGDRPAHMRSAHILGREGQESLQKIFIVLIQGGVASTSCLVVQCLGIVVCGVSLDPVVDTLPGDPEHAGQFRGGTSLVELQDGQGAPIDAGIQGFGELTPQTASLPRGQVQSAHALLLQS
jgi:hypothetical protein